ncbi:hypothetical protein [Cupriavidus sp. RAF12]|uniref:hypothetical protein n=1 Tax=Cupriavidus sp. RAF12 TaxID=3233050 RepID=UPI003F8EA72A
MEAQTLFNTVAKHLMVQGRRAVTENGSVCMYRAPGGCKCAVGVLVPDDIYDDRMEGKGIPRLISELDSWDLNEPLGMFIKDVLEPHYALLHALQNVHDQCDVTSWRYELSVVASRFNLNLPEVLQ